MKHRLFAANITCLRALVFSLALVVAFAAKVNADAIPYSPVGTVNPVTYTFTAMSTGPVVAYFAGSGAAYDERLGMLVNGVLTGAGYGLDNHTSALGSSFNLGNVTAGDTLTFVIDVYTGFVYGTGTHLGQAYSDRSLNGPFDSFYSPTPAVNHVYSTNYTATSPIIDSIPTGTYVAFEDLPASNPPDYNYHDETYVFTNVASSPSVPEPIGACSLLGMSAMGLIGVAWRRKRPTA
jgi:hypothetical protein